MLAKKGWKMIVVVVPSSSVLIVALMMQVMTSAVANSFPVVSLSRLSQQQHHQHRQYQHQQYNKDDNNLQKKQRRRWALPLSLEQQRQQPEEENTPQPEKTATMTDSAFVAAAAAVSSVSDNDDSFDLKTPPPSSSSSFDCYVPNYFPKQTEEILFLQNIVVDNFLFQDFAAKYDDDKYHYEKNRKKKKGEIDEKVNNNTTNALSGIIGSFERYTYKNRGTVLCEQGDMINTDYLYVIANGTCSVSIDGKRLPHPYGSMGMGSMIGDLALLYGDCRAATVQCDTKSVTVYRLHRSDFYYHLDANNREITNSTATTAASNINIGKEIKKQVKEIDGVIDEISGVKKKYDGSIIRQYRPQRSWLWRRWKGTILQHAWKPAVANMVVSTIFIMTLRLVASERIFHAPITWPIGEIPDANHPLILRMKGLYKLWGYTMSITTFVLTFFLSQAYALWRNIYTCGRKIQGRLNDVSLVLACSVERNKNGEYTDRGLLLLNDVAMSCRLCHAFSWAGFVKRYQILLSPRGLSRMLSRGVMNRSQYENLVSIEPSACKSQHASLMWILARIFQGMREGIISSDPATRSLFINKICDLRGTFGSVGDTLDGRIPIVYAHFVQLIVDIFLVLAPFALYCELGFWSIPAVGILNIFYSGMLDLSKILLDPLDNDNFYKDSAVNMDVGVLIRESNAGSNRWMTGLEKLPFKYSK